MSLNDLINVATDLSGVPGIDTAIALVQTLYTNVHQIKVFREQCRELSNRCIKLLLALRESALNDLQDSEMLKAADEVELTIATIHMRMQYWASLSRVKSFLHQSDIKEGIDASYRELDGCFKQFQTVAQLDLAKGQQDLVAIQERDHAELRETLQTILKNTDDLRNIAGMQRPVVEGFMQSIQEELQSTPDTDDSQEREQLRQGLLHIHQKTELLPPMIDLTGQVQKISPTPILCGTFNDIFVGTWLDEEKVALRLPRALVNNPMAKDRFLKEVEIWRRLQHPNVTRLYGVAYFHDQVHLVSKWMEKGTAMKYIQTTPDADRRRILSEVASGMEYLHANKIVHGDLRGANVLVSSAGKSCLSDFGFSSLLEESVDQKTHGTPSSSRWTAPELIDPNIIGRDNVLPSTYTDVWSFGMLCLELMTGEQPYNGIPKEINVALQLVGGHLPQRPGSSATARGLTDELWTLMQQCWRKEPTARPTMGQIRLSLKDLRGGGSDISVSASPRPAPIPLGKPSPANPSSGTTTTPLLSPHSATPQNTSTIDKGKGKRPATAPTQPSSAPPSAETKIRRHVSSLSARFSRKNSTSASSPTQQLFASASANHSHVPGSPNDLRLSPGNSFAALTPSPEREPFVPLPDSLHMNSARRSSSFRVGDPSLLMTRSSNGPLSPTAAQPISTTRRASGGSNLFASRRSGETEPEPDELDMPISTSLPSQFSASSSSGHSRAYQQSPYFSDESAASSALESALHDKDIVVHHAQDGSVTSGTLEGLIDRLVIDSRDRKKDLQFRYTFLATHPTFVKSRDVLYRLVERYNDSLSRASSGPQRSGEDQVTLRYNILSLIRTWLMSRFTEVNIDVLSDIKEFCLSIRSSTVMRELASEVVKRVDERLARLQSANMLPSPTGSTSALSDSVPKAKDISPKDLAIALTIIEGDRWGSIRPADYIHYFTKNPGHNPIEMAWVTNNTIVSWVKKSILRSENVEIRGETFKFFVHVAEECRLLRNFASMTAVVTALDSTAISRLTLTRDRLKNTKNAPKVLQHLISLVQPEHNHRAYRAILGEAIRRSQDQVRKECIPWLAVHLRDMNTIYAMKPITRVDGRPVVDFIRCTRLFTKIEDVDHFVAPDLSNSRAAGPLAYLESQLRGVPMHAKTDEALEARSIQLCAKEQRDRDLRLTQLRSVGFPT